MEQTFCELAAPLCRLVMVMQRHEHQAHAQRRGLQMRMGWTWYSELGEISPSSG